MIKLISRTTLYAVLLASLGLAQAQTQSPASRGQLLYSTHCIECHTVQMHWRTLRQARDWDSLKAQVQRWQNAIGLGWGEADVQEVARYLNGTIYQFPQPLGQLSSTVARAAPNR